MVEHAEPNTQMRVPLSRERVLRAAMALADEGGIDELTMRKLADDLGVKAMSLYNHVANKNDLLDGMIDEVYGEIALPAAGVEWKAKVRQLATSAHEVMLRHPWASTLHPSQEPGPKRFRYGNALLGAFRDAGFSKEVTYDAYHIIEAYILGFTFQVLSYQNVDMEQMSGVVDRFMTGDFLADYPHFTEHVRQHLGEESVDGHVDGYQLGLDLILNSLEPLRAES